MANAPTYLSCIVDDGKYAIGQGLVQAKKLKPHSFVTGDAYNFTPTEDATTVTGNVVYTGTAAQITGSIVAKDTFQFSCIYPETSGNFTIGNVMLYVESDDGTVFPFIWVVSKIPRPKQGIEGNGVGNRYIFNFIEKIINANDVLAITVTPPAYFSLAGFKSESDLPPATQALFQQFLIQQPSYAPAPILGARRALDNSYWGLPLYFRIGTPFFGVLDGGRAGELRSKQYTSRYFWGGRLNMPANKITTQYGGAKLTDKPVYTVGGTPLPTNPGYPTI